MQGRTKAGLNKATEGRETSRVSKCKIYSENTEIKGNTGFNATAISLRRSFSTKKGIPPAKNAVKDIASDDGDNRHSQETLDVTKVRRKALADVSNVRRTLSKLDKPSSSRKSSTFGTHIFAASSSQPMKGKVKPNETHGITNSHITVKATTKALTICSNLYKAKANKNVENKPRTNNSSIRKSYPESKSSQFVAHKSQGDGRCPKIATRHRGFSLNTWTGGKVVSQVSYDRGKVMKDRVSNIVMVSKNQTSKDVPQRQRKPIKTDVRSSSQLPNACSNSTSSHMDKSLVRIHSRETNVAQSSISKSLNSMDSCEEVCGRLYPSKGSGNVKVDMLKTTADKKSNRRKSYTSLLISKSKLSRNKNEVMEDEKLPNIDDADNPLEVAEYVDDIYQYYWIMETQSASLENYMTSQLEITPQMRGILVNWLIEVHFKFDLMPETLYLTVALLDNFLSLVPINKKEMQLVGLTSLLLASKYEDFWHPRIKELISISAESYTRKQMLDMEKVILKKLKFRLNLPTAYVFMLRFLKASQSDEQLKHFAFYLIELCLVEYGALKFKPSLLCASAVYVARCTLNKVPAWTPLLSRHARYEETHIRDCAEMINGLNKAARTGLLKVTYEKYKMPEFGGVATIKALDTLPL